MDRFFITWDLSRNNLSSDNITINVFVQRAIDTSELTNFSK